MTGGLNKVVILVLTAHIVSGQHQSWPDTTYQTREIDGDIQTIERLYYGAEADEALLPETRVAARKVKDRTETLLNELKKQATINADRSQKMGSRLDNRREQNVETFGETMKKVGNFVKDMKDSGPAFMKAVKEGNTTAAWKTGLGIAAAAISLIPHPLFTLAGAVLSMISAFLVVGDAAEVDLFADIKRDLEQAPDEIKKELTQFTNREALGKLKILTNMYRMHSMITERYDNKTWDVLWDLRMIPRDEMAVNEMKNLRTRIKELKSKPVKFARYIYMLLHTYSKISSIREMVYVKFAMLAPGPFNENNVDVRGFMEKNNINRYHAMETLECLHKPDEESVLYVHYFYPPGHDDTSETIYSLTSNLCYLQNFQELETQDQANFTKMPEPFSLSNQTNYKLRPYSNQNRNMAAAASDVYGRGSDAKLGATIHFSAKSNPPYINVNDQGDEKPFYSMCLSEGRGCQQINYIESAESGYKQPEGSPLFVRPKIGIDRSTLENVRVSGKFKIIKIDDTGRGHVAVIGDSTNNLFLKGTGIATMSKLDATERRVNEAFKFYIERYT